MPISIVGPVDQSPSSDSTSPDGLIRAQVVDQYAGVFITVDYRTLLEDAAYDIPNPFRATVYRYDFETEETVIVRGGNDRSQYGGVFYLYDDEVEFGKIYAYYAEAPARDGSLARRSYGAQVLTWTPPGGLDLPGVWVKSLDRPELSQPVRVASWTTFTYSTKNTTAEILNSRYPAYNLGIRQAGTSQMTVLTADRDEYNAMLELFDFGVVYITGLRKHNRRTGYYIVGDITASRMGEKAYVGYNAWDLPIASVARPDTSGQWSLSVPWRNLKDRQAEFPLLRDVTLADREYRDGVIPA